MLAEKSSLRVTRVAHLQAEHVAADEVNPFDDLSVRLVGGEVTTLDELLERSRVHAETVCIDETSERVTLLIITVGVKLKTSKQMATVSIIDQ